MPLLMEERVQRKVSITMAHPTVARMEHLIEKYPELGYTNLTMCVKDAITRHTEHLERRVKDILDEIGSE